MSEYTAQNRMDNFAKDRMCPECGSEVKPYKDHATCTGCHKVWKWNPEDTKSSSYKGPKGGR